MFLASSAVLALAVASVSAHSIHHVRRHHAPRAQPSGWALGYLEDYDVYHTRYIAIKCEDKHNTTFFDMCCHPMLATETLEKNRAPCCAPGSTAQCPSSSSSAAAPASTLTDDDDCDDDGDAAPTAGSVGDDDDDDCDDEDGGEDASSTVISTKGASSTPTAAAEDDDDEDCEEDGDDNSSAAQRTKTVDHATKAATSTHAVVSPASTHSSSEEAPTTTHKTTTTVKASPTSAEESTKTTSPTSSPSGVMITGGFGTWFTQNGVAGACGTVHKDSDFVFALPDEAYANGANCGRKMRVYDASHPDTFVDGLVTDECPTCDNQNCVDMSVAAFQVLASLSTGELKITYQFLQN